MKGKPDTHFAEPFVTDLSMDSRGGVVEAEGAISTGERDSECEVDCECSDWGG
jgi:hypothetical protein